MNRITTVLAATLTAGLLLLGAGTAAHAQSPDDTDAETRLAQAQRELADAARRVAELSQQVGGEARRIALERVQSAGTQRPRVGLVLGPAEGDGVAVRGVTPEGPADEAGLRSGDIIESIDGEALAATDTNARLRQARDGLSRLEDGQRVELSIRRDGEARQFAVQARPLPASLWAGDLDAIIDTDVRERLESLGNLRELGLIPLDIDMQIGRILPFAGCGEDAEGECRAPRLLEALRWRALNLAAVGPELGRYFDVERGVLVVSTNDRIEGLQPGDVILSIDGTDVDTPMEAMRELSRHPAGTSIALRVQRDGRARDIRLEAPEAATS